MGKIRNGAKMLLAAAAGVGQLEIRVIADNGKVTGVEEGAGVGEFGAFAAIAETVSCVGDGEVHVELVPGSKGLFKRVNGVEIARARGDLVEWSVEAEVRDRLPAIDDVDLGNWVWCLVLKEEVAPAREGAALGKDVDVGVDGEDLRLGKELILFEVSLVLGLDVTLCRGANELIKDVGVIEVPCPAANGDKQ